VHVNEVQLNPNGQWQVVAEKKSSSNLPAMSVSKKSNNLITLDDSEDELLPPPVKKSRLPTVSAISESSKKNVEVITLGESDNDDSVEFCSPSK
jgi:hypothetical protein